MVVNHVRRSARFLVGLMVLCLLLPTLLWAAPTFASTLPAVLTDHFQTGTLAPLTVAGGNWNVSQGTLIASNYGIRTPLDKQFVYVPTNMTDEVILAQVTITATPGNGNWRVGIFTHGTGTANPQKWALILRGGTLSLLDENTSWVSQMPFTSSPGQTYSMELAVEGTTVNGRVWLSSQPEPTTWTITGRFPPNGTRFGKAAGLYVANADASFSTFDVMVAPPSLAVTPNQPGAIFLQGQASGYKASITNTSGQAGNYQVAYTVDNLNGNAVDSGSVPASVPAQGTTTVNLPLPLPDLGYYTVSFALTSSDGFPIETLPATSLAQVPPPSEESDASNPVGMNGNLTYTATSSASGDVSDAFRTLREQGIGWYRLNMNSTTIFPTHASSTHPNWQSMDRLVVAAHGQGVTLLGLLTAWPDGMNPFGPKANVSFATALNAYVTYVRQVVERFSPGGTLAHNHGWSTYGISTWELWNEPVTRAYWGGTAAQYATLAEAAAQAIRSIQPHATILAYDDTPANLVAQDAGTYSGLSLHYYPGDLPPNNPTFSVYGTVLQNVPWAQKVGGSLWLTEAGWSTHDVTPEVQAQDWVETVLDSLTAGAAHVMLFTQIYPGSGFSEQHTDLTPKISYPALAAVNRRLSGYTPVGRLALGSSVIADAFSNQSGTMVAIWSPQGNGQLTLPSGSGPVVAYDWMDNPINPDGGSRIIVPLSPSPVYLVFPEDTPAIADAVLRDSTETNITPFSLSAAPQASSSAQHPVVSVTINNSTNQPLGGTLTLTLPSGWSGQPTASLTSQSVYDPSLNVGPIPVNGSFNAVFTLNTPRPVARYRLIASMTSVNGGPPVTLSTTVDSVFTGSTAGDRPSLKKSPKAKKYGS